MRLAVAPKGDAESWKIKTRALVDAAQDLVNDKPGARDELKEASNCAGGRIGR